MWSLKYLVLASTLYSVQGNPNFLLKEDNLFCVSTDNNDYELQRSLFSDNDAIKSLNFTYCGISKIKCETFSGLPSLRAIDLSKNNIHTLDRCMLNGLDHLLYLDISYNGLDGIPTGFFNSVSNVEVLKLQGNMFRTLKTDTFASLLKLRSLNLANNELAGEKLNAHLFDNLNMLTYLNLTKNDLLNAPDNLLNSLPSLQYLILDLCFLREVPPFATRHNMKTLKHLSLSTNLISTLDSSTTFVNLEDLEVLDLSMNNIQSVHENVFAPLKKIKTIYLRRNMLINVPEKLFQSLPKLINVDLAFNAIEKIQVATFRNSPIKNLNLSGNKLSYLPENFCQQLINGGGRLNKFLFSHNPWQCGCLRDILDEVKAFGLVYNRDKYSGHDAVCITGITFDCVRN